LVSVITIDICYQAGVSDFSEHLRDKALRAADMRGDLGLHLVWILREGQPHGVRLVALTAGQVTEHGLPPQPGKELDSRAPAFVQRHGRLVQVELDALPPDVLRDLFAGAIGGFWNSSANQTALDREDRGRRLLKGRA
jgi:hypothetical protein